MLASKMSEFKILGKHWTSYGPESVKDTKLKQHFQIKNMIIEKDFNKQPKSLNHFLVQVFEEVRNTAIT